MRTVARKWFALGGLSVAGLAVGLWLTRDKEAAQPNARPGETDLVAVAAAPTSAPRVPGCSFEPGAALAYVIEVVVDAQLEVEAPGAKGAHFTSTTRARLDLRALQADPEKGTVLLGRYRDVDAQTKARAGDLTTPFLLRVDGRCQLAGFARLDTASIGPARAEQALAYELMFRWPTSERETGAGESSLGKYRASFVMAERTPAVLDREVLAYTRVWSDEWQRAGIVTPPTETVDDKRHVPRRSHTRIALGDGPWFESLVGSEAMTSVGGFESVSQVNARRVAADGQSLHDAPATEARYVWEDLLPRKVRSVAVDQPTTLELAAQKSVKNFTLPEVVQRYEARVATGGDFAASWPEVRSYLEARPESATDLAKRLRAGDVADGGTAGAFVALGQARTTEARDALLGFMNDTSAPPIDRARSAFALVGRADVGVELAQRLRSSSQAITTGASREERLFAREAALALGMMGGLRGAEEPEIMREGHAAVAAILGAGVDATSLSPGFGALANLGDVALLPLVERFSRSQDESIREAAAIGFRRMNPRATDAMVTAWLARESSPEVKRELYHVVHLQELDAMTGPSPAIVAQAMADLHADPPPGVLTRQSIIRILGPAAKNQREVHAALVAQVRHELEVQEGLVDLLAYYLSGDGSSGAAGSAGATP